MGMSGAAARTGKVSKEKCKNYYKKKELGVR